MEDFNPKTMEEAEAWFKRNAKYLPLRGLAFTGLDRMAWIISSIVPGIARYPAYVGMDLVYLWWADLGRTDGYDMSLWGKLDSVTDRIAGFIADRIYPTEAEVIEE